MPFNQPCVNLIQWLCPASQGRQIVKNTAFSRTCEATFGYNFVIYSESSFPESSSNAVFGSRICQVFLHVAGEGELSDVLGTRQTPSWCWIRRKQGDSIYNGMKVNEAVRL